MTLQLYLMAKGYVIRNLFIKRDKSNAGLFASIGSGTVQNLALEGGFIRSIASNTDSVNVGFLAGKNAGTIMQSLCYRRCEF